MMADWTTLPNTAVGVGGLPSGATVTALRDNPVAIAEGAAGAPVASQAWHPIGISANGSNEGVIYDFAVDGGISTFGFNVQAGYEYKVRLEGLYSTGSGGRNLLVEVDINSTWRQFTIFGLAGTVEGSPFNNRIWTTFDMRSLGSIRPIYDGQSTLPYSITTAANTIGGAPPELTTISGTTTSPLRLAPSARGLPTEVRFRLSSGTYAGGKVFVAQRRFWGGI
jgi:hypothetical protein